MVIIIDKNGDLDLSMVKDKDWALKCEIFYKTYPTWFCNTHEEDKKLKRLRKNTRRNYEN